MPRRPDDGRSFSARSAPSLQAGAFSSFLGTDATGANAPAGGTSPGSANGEQWQGDQLAASAGAPAIPGSIAGRMPEVPRPYVHSGAPATVLEHNIRTLDNGAWVSVKVTRPTILLPTAQADGPIYLSPHSVEQAGDLTAHLWAPRARPFLDTPIGIETTWNLYYAGTGKLRMLQIDASNPLVAAQLLQMPGFRVKSNKFTLNASGGNGIEIAQNDFRRSALTIINLDGATALRYQIATPAGAAIGAAYSGAYGLISPGKDRDFNDPMTTGYNFVAWSDGAAIQCAVLEFY